MTNPPINNVLVSEIAAAYLSNPANRVAIDDIGKVIEAINLALMGKPAEPEPVKPEPAVTARKSVTHDAVTCMCCGEVGKSLKRHIRVKHGLTPEAYREMWSLPASHPLVAPAYSERRSQLAKDNGLGTKR